MFHLPSFQSLRDITALLSLITCVASPAVSADNYVLAVSDASVVEGDNGTNAMEFEITRGGDLDSNVVVDFVTASGGPIPATGGDDYQGTSGRARLLEGEINKAVPVTVFGDEGDELDETFRLLLGSAEAFDPKGTLDPGTGINGNTQPTALVVRDLNGDGLKDFVTASQFNGNLSILLADGNGGFAPAPGSPVQIGTPPAVLVSALGAGDFDGDGNVDLVATEKISDSAFVLLNDGSGSFTEVPQGPFSVGRQPVAVGVAEISGDSHMDFVVANRIDDNASVFLGDGQGNFSSSPGSPVYLNGGPTSLSVADVDGDDIADLIATNRNLDKLTILYGQGNGQFSFAQSASIGLPTNSEPLDLAVDDLNGDGHADIAVANAIVVSDIDGDQIWSSVLFNDGSGGFTETEDHRIQTSMRPYRVRTGDVVGDGHPDILISGEFSNLIRIWSGSQNGSFMEADVSPVTTRSEETGGFAVSDIDDSGAEELVVANQFEGDISILKGLRAGAVARVGNPIIPLSHSVEAMASADFDGDGNVDVAIAGESMVTVYAGDGDGTFSAFSGSPLSDGGTGAAALVAGDVTGEGVPDLIKSSHGADSVSIWAGDGQGGFEELDGSPLSVSEARVIAVDDWVGDAHPELLVSSSPDGFGTVFISILAYREGQGVVELEGSPKEIAPRSSEIAIGDVTGDGHADIVSGIRGPRQIHVYAGDGIGYFSETANSPFSYCCGNFLEGLTMHDIEGDGDLDLLVGSDDVRHLLNDGSGSFSYAGFHAIPGTKAKQMSMIDVTGDGDKDLVTGGTLLTVSAADGAGGFHPGRSMTIGSLVMVADDFTGDGIGEAIVGKGPEPYFTLARNSPNFTVDTVDPEGIGTIIDDDMMSLSGMSPTSGPAQAATVSITGERFSTSVTVGFGGQPAANVNLASGSELIVTTPDLTAGSLNPVLVDVAVAGNTPEDPLLAGIYFADFLDVPGWHLFHNSVETLVRNGVTAGCGAGQYCVDESVRRDQMAVFLLTSAEGIEYDPPACNGEFSDVACPENAFADWIEELAARGITAGCGNGNYCPTDAVTRAQMAAFLLRGVEGAAYEPPPCTAGDETFDDVPHHSGFCPWIEELAARGITAGCGDGDYCPDAPVERGQMAVFLVKSFQLPAIP